MTYGRLPLILSQEFLRLASFALNTDASVKEVMQAKDLDDIFFLPLSCQAHEEFQLLQTHRICHMMTVTVIAGRPFGEIGTP